MGNQDLGHLHLQGLKDTILIEPNPDDEEDGGKNAKAYTELIQFRDDKSLSLVMREVADDGREALKILREYYAGKGKPRIINLYTTSLQKSPTKNVLPYMSHTLSLVILSAPKVKTKWLLLSSRQSSEVMRM